MRCVREIRQIVDAAEGKSPGGGDHPTGRVGPTELRYRAHDAPIDAESGSIGRRSRFARDVDDH